MPEVGLILTIQQPRDDMQLEVFLTVCCLKYYLELKIVKNNFKWRSGKCSLPNENTSIHIQCITQIILV